MLFKRNEIHLIKIKVHCMLVDSIHYANSNSLIVIARKSQNAIDKITNMHITQFNKSLVRGTGLHFAENW